MYEVWKLFFDNSSSYRVRTEVLTKFTCDLDLWPIDLKINGVFSSHHPASMYEIWKLYFENYWCQNHSVDKVQLWPRPFDQKCIGIFLSQYCIYVWNMKAVHWKLVKLSCQNPSVDKVQLWPWPLDFKMYRYLPLAILHLCMKYESCTLKTNYRGKTKVLTSFSCDLDVWPFDLKMYRHLPLTILHLCMKYENCTLKTTQVIVSEPRYWQSSVVQGLFWLLPCMREFSRSLQLNERIGKSMREFPFVYKKTY